MKKFTKMFLAALLAVVVGGMLSTLLWVIVLLSVAGSSSNAVMVEPHSVLKIDMADNIVNAPSANPLAGIDLATMQTSRSLTLLNVLRALDAAKDDERIDGVYLNFTGTGSVSATSLEELRGAIADFRDQSDKWVVAYNDTYSQFSYYLASVADRVYIHPEGSMQWQGLSSTLLFFKGAMDKLGLKAEVFRPTVCKYKSAVEPYVRTDMSPANRAQMQELCDDMWAVLVEAVSASRGIAIEDLNRMAARLEVALPEDAVRLGLVDGVKYNDQMEEVFEELGAQRNVLGEIPAVSLGDYCSTVYPDVVPSAPQVGVIYADGEIADGDAEGVDGVIFGTTLASTLADVRKDESIKAVVLRVNSPGGSALASDVIWREMELLRAEKPVIVSMGDYAASGGYYISAPADAILADRMTLTGSIGVFGLFLDGGGMLKNKLGLTTDGVKTAPSADFGSGVAGMMLRSSTAAERQMIMKGVDRVYTTFTEKVAAGRNLPIDKVLDVAEGRVWSGTQATRNGLADGNGGLKAAIALAADRAGAGENFTVTEIMGEQSPFALIVQSLGVRLRALVLSDGERALMQEYNALQRALSRHGVQMLCPMQIRFE